MTIGKRVAKLRAELGMSQQSFGDKIGVTKSTISKAESGVAELTERNAMLICRTFGVRKSWLLEGKGEMFKDEVSAESIIAMLDIVDPLDAEIILAYLRLPERHREAFRELVRELIGR